MGRRRPRRKKNCGGSTALSASRPSSPRTSTAPMSATRPEVLFEELTPGKGGNDGPRWRGRTPHQQAGLHSASGESHGGRSALSQDHGGHALVAARRGRSPTSRTDPRMLGLRRTAVSRRAFVGASGAGGHARRLWRNCLALGPGSPRDRIGSRPSGSRPVPWMSCEHSSSTSVNSAPGSQTPDQFAAAAEARFDTIGALGQGLVPLTPPASASVAHTAPHHGR